VGWPQPRWVAPAFLLIYSLMFAAGFLLRPAEAARVVDFAWQKFVNPNLGNVAAYLVVLAIVLAVEAMVLGWRRSSVALLLRPSQSAKADLCMAGLRITGYSIFLDIAATGGGRLLSEQLAIELEWVAADIPRGIIHFAMFFVFADFLEYWFHRLSHEFEFLWQPHKYHHAATEFTVLTGNRVHSIESVLQHLFTLLPLVLLGAPLVYYAAIVAAKRVVDLLQHSMVPWTYGWVGRWLVMSPVGHRVHHSPELEHWDKNFGDITPLWDRIFGTWYDGARVNDRVDVTDNPYNRDGVLRDYMHTFNLTAQAFARSWRTGQWRTPSAAETRRSAV
jgi:sterol desaturase/sphingolipid hydroxylase (fatty acid hydroxylase superfamily)